jgi:hypothetical protein
MMQLPRWILLTAMLPCALLQALNEVPLPKLNELERKSSEQSDLAPGVRILTDETGPDLQQEPELMPLDLGQPAPEEPAASRLPTSELPEKYLEAYFGRRPQTYLVDPQKLLNRQEDRDRLDAILQDHANDSAIDLFIYLFNKDQAIPSAVREEELCERFFAEGRPALVVYYHLGAPPQALLYLSPSLTDRVAPAEQRLALQSAVMEASKKSTPDEQLEAFTVQMTIRIYWMERLLGGSSAAAGDPQQGSKARPSKLAKKPSALAVIWDELRPFAAQLAIPGGALAGVIAVALGIVIWRRWRATYQFPEVAVEPRLGGDHAAGVGAVICFSNTAPAPQSQREQVAESSRWG